MTSRAPHAAYRAYERSLVERLWRYRSRQFEGRDDLFDHRRPPSPPVLSKGEALWNVLSRPGADAAERERLLAVLPRGANHRWLGSMKSSQALVWSVFANLAVANRLDLLADLRDRGGRPLLPGVSRPDCLHLEHDVTTLGEPTPTSVDALLDVGGYWIAVEGKLTEQEVGACSRPRPKPDDKRYCDGTYSRQQNRRGRCALSEIGVAYWRHVPTLFAWPADEDHDPCPLRTAYQLVRNVLAATVRADGRADSSRGHAVLLYDQRNPQFGPGGAAWWAVEDVRGALHDKGLLRLGTWQHVAGAMAGDSEVGWLADELEAKYGILASD